MKTPGSRKCSKVIQSNHSLLIVSRAMQRFEQLLKNADPKPDPGKSEMETYIDKIDNRVSTRMSLKASKRFITARSTISHNEYFLTHKCNLPPPHLPRWIIRNYPGNIGEREVRD